MVSWPLLYCRNYFGFAVNGERSDRQNTHNMSLELMSHFAVCPEYDRMASFAILAADNVHPYVRTLPCVRLTGDMPGRFEPSLSAKIGTNRGCPRCHRERGTARCAQTNNA